jgi:hypothetical protein
VQGLAAAHGFFAAQGLAAAHGLTTFVDLALHGEQNTSQEAPHEATAGLIDKTAPTIPAAITAGLFFSIFFIFNILRVNLKIIHNNCRTLLVCVIVL